MKRIRCRKPYPVLEGDVSLDVVVGEGHKGDIAIYLDEKLLDKGSDELRGIELGPADDVLDSRLRISALVSPVNTASPRVSVTAIFRRDAGNSYETCDGGEHEDELVTFKVLFSRG